MTHLKLPKKCPSIIIRKGDYRTPCPPYKGTSFPTALKPWPNQIHHILCEHAIVDLQVDKAKFDYIKDCLCIANWDINSKRFGKKGHNLIGLPLKDAYKQNYGKAPINLPCHDVDHPDYTDEVNKWLHKNVWNSLVVQQKVHQVAADAIKKQLNTCTSNFKGVLKRRGRRNKGTLWSWEHQRDAGQEKKWYKPFSTSATPRKRAPYRHPKPQFTIIK
jgi:hypothetical protein